ncbi:MAG TPA: phage major capsid protein, partial [Anaerolineae bacterium]
MALDLVSLRQNRAKAYDKLEAILAAEASATQQADFDAASAIVESMDRDIANAEKLTKLRGSKALGAPAAIDSEDVFASFPEAKRALLTSHAGLPIQVREQMIGFHERPFANLGEQMQAVHRAAVVHDRDPRLVAAALGANETIPQDGGFLVQVDSSTEILKRTFDKANLAAKVRRFPLGPNSNGMKINALKDDSRATGSRYGGVRGYWLAEAASLTASGP